MKYQVRMKAPQDFKAKDKEVREMEFKYILVYYLKNGQYGIEYFNDKEKAEKQLQFYQHNSNYASAQLIKKA